MTTLRLEEESPVVSPNGWHATVRINQIGVSPGGSERVLRSASYRFKQGAPNETDEQRGLRLDVKRNAKKRAMDKFDSEKVAQTRTKRRKSGAAAAGLAAPGAGVPPCLQLLCWSHWQAHSPGPGCCHLSDHRSSLCRATSRRSAT